MCDRALFCNPRLVDARAREGARHPGRGEQGEQRSPPQRLRRAAGQRRAPDGACGLRALSTHSPPHEPAAGRDRRARRRVVGGAGGRARLYPRPGAPERHLRCVRHRRRRAGGARAAPLAGRDGRRGRAGRGDHRPVERAPRLSAAGAHARRFAGDGCRRPRHRERAGRLAARHRRRRFRRKARRQCRGPLRRPDRAAARRARDLLHTARARASSWSSTNRRTTWSTPSS